MWYFVIAAEAAPLVVVSPIFWALVLAFLLLAWAGIRIRPLTPEQMEHTPLSLLLLLAVPVLIVAFSIWQRAAQAGKPDAFYWQDAVLLGLLATQVILAAWLVRRLRHRAFAVVAGLLALWYTSGALFVAGMAITDVWL
jgi:hypothetical protein